MKKLLFLLPLMILLVVSNTVEAKKVKYPNGDYYEGGWKKGQPNGIGKMQYANGCIYEGEWTLGVMNGKGKCTDNINNTFEGYFEDGIPRIGKLFLIDGGYCEGNFQSFNIDNIMPLSLSCGLYTGICENYIRNKGCFTGKMLRGKYDEGKLIQSNGGWFEGKWEDGKLYNGICENYEKNNERFTGKILNGKYDGKLIQSNGGWFEGKWEEGKLHNGICDNYEKNNEKYTGNILNGKYDQGKLMRPNGGWFEGKWEDGRFYNGKGKWDIDSNFYDGEWINGEFHGKCKLKFVNSKEGLKTFDGVMGEGETMEGTVEYMDNTVYKGVLKNKKKEGYGILYSSTKEITIEGEWKEDNIIQGKVKYEYTNNTYPFTINKSNDIYNINFEIDKGFAMYEHKINNNTQSIYSTITNALLDLRKKQEEEEREKKQIEEEREKKKRELIAIQKDKAAANYYYWTPSEILRLYEENPAKFDETFYGSFLGDATLIRAKIANIRRETEVGLFGDDIYYDIYLEGGVVVRTYKNSVVSQIRRGQTVFMLAKYRNKTTNKYGYTQYPIFRLVTDEFIANSIDAVSKYFKEKRETGEKVYENYYFRNCVRNIYR